MNILNAMEFGVKTYINDGPIVGLSKLSKSSFNPSETMLFSFISLVTMAVITIVLIILGIKAVDNLCYGMTTRSKYIRIVLYILLLLTGGQISILYILLSWLNVRLCS